jgi:hypothetical protein
MERRQKSQLDAPGTEEAVTADAKRIGPPALKRGEVRVDLAATADVKT